MRAPVPRALVREQGRQQYWQLGRGTSGRVAAAFGAVAVASDKFCEIGAPGVVNELRIVAESLEQSFDIGGVCAEFFGNDL